MVRLRGDVVDMIIIILLDCSEKRVDVFNPNGLHSKHVLSRDFAHRNEEANERKKIALSQTQRTTTLH